MKTIEATNFIEQIINDDIENGKINAVQTRFPPEPNGYLHIGHIKSMLVNFGTAKKYEGKCNLFFDDTNPSKEKTEFVDAIRKDISWVGYDWAKEVYASDFFDIIYEYAEKLILDGKAFVCDLSAEQMAEIQNKVLVESKRLMGGASSEGGCDHVAANIDYINYIERDMKKIADGKESAQSFLQKPKKRRFGADAITCISKL